MVLTATVMDKKWTLLVAIFGFLLHTGVCKQVQQKILMSSINTITLREGKFTTGRRVAPVRQLRCVSAAAPCKSLPTVVQCYNKGSDGLNVQWRCEAQMSKRVMFDTIQVSCEGYDHPNDPYILAGSCGLTYSLRPSGRHRHRNRNHAYHKSGHLFRRVHVVNPMVSILTSLLALTVVVAMLALVFKLFRSRRHRYHQVYTAEEGPPPHAAPYGYHHGGVTGGSGPGFWTGAAVGGMAGYMMGSTPHHFGGQSAPCEVAYESDFVLGGDGDGAFSDDGIGSAVGFGSGWNR